MKKRLFLWLLSLPVMGYSQYYVGHELAYPISEFPTGSGSFIKVRGAIASDGSTYIFKPHNLRKFTTSGILAPGFENNGVASIIPLNEFSSSMSVNDQYIYVGSYTKIGRHTVGGTPDLSFGVNGVVTFTQKSVYTMVANPDSSLFVKLSGKIARLFPNGQEDNSFVINPNASEWDFYVGENNIYVFTYNYNSGSYSYTITKYDFNGVKDTQYGNGGSLQVLNSSVVLDKASGNIYAQASPISSITMPSGITRYTSAGVLDYTFGTGGTALGDFPLEINRVISDSNNNILFFGGHIGAGTNKAVIFRLKQNGEVDNTFNNGSYKYISKVGAYAGAIVDARLVDDNTYICIENLKPTMSSAEVRTNKYLRTQDISKIQTLSVKDVNVTKTDVLQVYPSPASDFIKIEAGKNDKITKVNIYAITGGLVLSTNKSEIDIKHLATGSYIVEATVNNNIYKNKFIKK